MFYLPVDLFSPYIEGREMAIDRNWNDLNQSNKVEGGWLANDAQLFKNQFTQDTYGDELARSGARARSDLNRATASDLQTQLATTGQPGALASVQSLSDFQRAQANANRQNIPQIAADQALFQRAQAADDAARGRALMQYSPALRGQQLLNEQATLGFNQATIAANQQLLPAQTAATAAGFSAQQRASEGYVPTQRDMMAAPLFPQPGVAAPAAAGQVAPSTPAAPATLDLQGIRNAASALQPGQRMEVGGMVIERDGQGLFTVINGVKQYIAPPPQSSASGIFATFGGQ